MFFKVGDIVRQGVGAIEDQVLGKLALLAVDLGIGRDMRRVDNSHIQARFHSMIEEDAIENGARVWFQSE